jgi:hypothetical protein
MKRGHTVLGTAYHSQAPDSTPGFLVWSVLLILLVLCVVLCCVFCFVCFRLVSCLPNVANVSGLCHSWLSRRFSLTFIYNFVHCQPSVTILSYLPVLYLHCITHWEHFNPLGNLPLNRTMPFWWPPTWYLPSFDPTTKIGCLSKHFCVTGFLKLL